MRLALTLVLALLLAPGLAAQAPPDAPVALRLPVEIDARDPATLAPRLEHTPLPAASSGLGPGALLLVTVPGDGTVLCTANFVWASGADLYLGTAGHCLLPPGKTATHGLGADHDAAGVRVRACVAACFFGGAAATSAPGILVELGEVAYARQRSGATGQPVGSDFGLVKIPPSLHAQARPSMPVWGGPTTASPPPSGVWNGLVCTYGNGLGVAETLATKARAGNGLGGTAVGGWEAALPVANGDSGAAVVTCGRDANGVHGLAPLGILTHVSGVPATSLSAPVQGFGTTVATARALAAEAGLSIDLLTG